MLHSIYAVEIANRDFIQQARADAERDRRLSEASGWDRFAPAPIGAARPSILRLVRAVRPGRALAAVSIR